MGSRTLGAPTARVSVASNPARPRPRIVYSELSEPSARLFAHASTSPDSLHAIAPGLESALFARHAQAAVRGKGSVRRGAVFDRGNALAVSGGGKAAGRWLSGTRESSDSAYWVEPMRGVGGRWGVERALPGAGWWRLSVGHADSDYFDPISCRDRRCPRTRRERTSGEEVCMRCDRRACERSGPVCFNRWGASNGSR